MAHPRRARLVRAAGTETALCPTMALTVDRSSSSKPHEISRASEPKKKADEAVEVRRRSVADTAGTGPTAAPTRETADVALKGARAQEALVRARLMDKVPVRAAVVDDAGGALPPHAQLALDTVKNGAVDDATRDALAAQFRGMTVDQSKEAMDAIRNAGLLDTFLDQTLRDASGNAVDPKLKAGVRDMMATGRLDAYAETLASTSFNVHDPATSGRTANPHFNPGENAIYFTADQLNAPSGELAKTLAHETYHAFASAHGGSTYSALDEGMGIAAIHYAFGDDRYSIAEAVYGTANYYRDGNLDPNYPLGTMANADPKLRELVGDFASRDTSGLAWNNSAQLASEYQEFWAPFNRFEDPNGNGVPEWSEAGGYAEQAEAAMWEARFERRRSGPR